MVLYKYGFHVVAVSFHLVDVHIAMALVGGIITDYAQDVAAMASVLSAVVQADIMKSNTGKETNKSKKKKTYESENNLDIAGIANVWH